MSFVRDQLADLIVSINYESLPPEVIREAKRLILDTLGCAFGGFAAEPSKIVRKTVRSLGGNPEATIIGEGRKTSCALATLANGTMIRYLDNNDYFGGKRQPAHPSGNLATALAIAERQGLGGKAVILGMVVNYEVHCRLCDCAGNPDIWHRGWHPGTITELSAAAVASKVLNLDSKATANALSISGSHNNTLAQAQHGNIPMMKASAEATIAKGGVEAALLAMNGMTGPEEFFEGKYGWANVIAGGVDFAFLTAPVSYYRILDAAMKPHAVDATQQAPISAAIELRKKYKLDASQIASIEIGLPDAVLKKPSWDAKKLDPKNRETADHSIPYGVSAAILDGAVGPEQFTAEKIGSPQIRELMSKVTLVEKPELTANWPVHGGSVAITTKSGETYEKIVAYPPGNPKNRLTDAQIQEKFYRLAHHVLDDRSIGRIVDSVSQFEKITDLSEFMQELVI